MWNSLWDGAAIEPWGSGLTHTCWAPARVPGPAPAVCEPAGQRCPLSPTACSPHVCAWDVLAAGSRESRALAKLTAHGRGGWGNTALGVMTPEGGAGRVLGAGVEESPLPTTGARDASISPPPNVQAGLRVSTEVSGLR